MARIRTGSESSSHSVAAFFAPGWAGAILYLLLGMIIIIALNAGSIISRLSNNYISSPERLRANFTTLSSGFSNSFSSALGGRLGQIMLWAFVGAIVYMGLWLARNVLNSFENDIISAHYLHPSGYSSVQTWGSSLSIKLFLVAEGIITVAYFFIALTAALPAVAAMAGSAAYNFNAHSSPLYIILAVLSAALILYIGVVLLRLLAHLWKLL
ncbi:MAG TPA: hypothetical protein VFH37_03490 [Candidatus Saccharimonadales bacterium]|nr:hypothetical protein [Candidatus Saccharimonadales bacterium]